MESIKTQQQALPLQLIEWVTITMAFAVLLPSFALLSPERIDAQIPILYALGWITLPFVAILRLAIWMTKKYAAYLLTMAACLVGGTGLGLFLGQRLLGGILGGIFAGATFLELLYVGGDADAIRRNAIRKKKAHEENDTLWVNRTSLLEYPRLPGCIVFLFSYLLALMTKSAFMCDVSLGSILIYLPLAMIHGYHRTMDAYLGTMHAVSNIPLRRILIVRRVILGILLGVFVLVTLLALPTRGLRHYGDIREWKVEIPRGEEELLVGGGGMSMAELQFLQALAPKRAPWIPPRWLNHLFEALFLLFLAYLLRILIRDIFHRFVEFAQSYDEGDIIISLAQEEKGVRRIRSGQREEKPDTQRGKIRRLYKKTIRKHRKERPHPAEMPIDIETIAGLAGTEEGVRLHVAYEEARYSQEETRKGI